MAEQEIAVGDALEVLRTLPDGCAHAVVTDPPYDLTAQSRKGSPRQLADNPYGRHRLGADRKGFMGKTWDGEGVAFRPEVWAEVLRVLRPGGHLLAFGGSRTYHRMACAVEDAGFEIRDSIAWIYGTGFPKSLDAERAGAGPEWAGWGTALKPAIEPVVVGRKALEGTVAECLRLYGCGAINVDGCRIAGAYETRDRDTDGGNSMFGLGAGGGAFVPAEGRWPANVVFSHAEGCERVGAKVVKSSAHYPTSRGPGGLSTSGHAGQEGLEERASGEEVVEEWRCVPGCQVAALDEQSGQLKSGANPTRRGSDKFRGIYNAFEGQRECRAARGEDRGGASRFYYCAKASKSERGEFNTHPTVKPVELMRWLVRLVAPPGALVIDPFSGSGTTGVACALEGFDFLGIEREEEYAEIARRRLAAAQAEVG